MKKALAILGTWAIAAAGVVAATSQTGSTQGGAFAAPNDFTGYATGTGVHVDLLHNLITPPPSCPTSPPAPPALVAQCQQGELADVSIGFGSAASNSNGLLSQYVAAGTPPPPNALNGPFNNEMGLPVVPPLMQSSGSLSLQPFDAYGRGVGI